MTGRTPSAAINDLDKLIAGLDEEAFGSIYTQPAVAQPLPPSNKSSTRASQARDLRADSLAKMMDSIDAEIENDRGRTSVSVSAGNGKQRTLSELMATPVAVPAWERSNTENSSAADPRRVATTSTYVGTPNRASSRPVSIIREEPVMQTAALEIAGEDFGWIDETPNMTSRPARSATNSQENVSIQVPMDSEEFGGLDRQCFGCNQVLGTEQRIKIQNHLYHVHCWKCLKCFKEIRNARYYIRSPSDFPYCESCYTNLLCEMCRKCGQPIQGQTVEALGGSYHESCFLCAVCGRGFGGRGFFVKNEQPLCENCIHAQTGTSTAGMSSSHAKLPCAGCNMPIVNEGSFTALNRTWHRRCFKCGVCGTELWCQAFYSKSDGKPYCSLHAQ